MNKNYTKLSTEELAVTEAFVDFVLLNKNEALWKQWLHQYPDQKNKVDQAKNLVIKISSSHSDVNDEQLAKIWNKIEQVTKPQLKVVGQPKQSSTLWIKWLSAAAAAVIIGFFLFTFNSSNELYHTNKGEQLVIFLPDSSKVTLAPTSNLEVLAYENERKLKLEGEAFFEVVKGSSFSVETVLGDVKVLGTSFNVSSFPKIEHFVVGCTTGKVKVRSGKHETILTPNMQTKKLKDELVTTHVNEPANIGSWQKGFYTAKNCSLEELTFTLERHYNRKFDIGKDLSDKFVTGQFPLNNLKLLSERLSFILNTKVDTSYTNVQIGE